MVGAPQGDGQEPRRRADGDLRDRVRRRSGTPFRSGSEDDRRGSSGRWRAPARASASAARRRPRRAPAPRVRRPPPEQSAKAWLALVDAGKYGESWDAAPRRLFKAGRDAGAVGRRRSTKVRAPLGRSCRASSAARRSRTRSAGCAGGGVRRHPVRHRVRERRAAMIETITPMKDKDGTWRVSGYFIK